MESVQKQIWQRPGLSIFLVALVLFMGLQYKPAVLNYTTRFVEDLKVLPGAEQSACR